MKKLKPCIEKNSGLWPIVSIKVFIILILLLGACASKEIGKIPRVAPELRFYNLTDGEIFRLHRYRGKTVILTFWATWCPYSRTAMERISKIVNGQMPRNQVLVFASLDKDTGHSEVYSFLKEYQLLNAVNSFSGNYTLDEAYMQISGKLLPSIFVIDPNGVIIDGGHDAGVFKKHFKH